MLSRNLMIGLLSAYVVIALVSACERQWPVTLYWVSASGILAAVLWMR